MYLYYKLKNKILSRFRKEVQPATYEFKRAEIEKISKQYGISVLVETGTFLGDTVEHFKKKFKKVYSIELAHELAEKAKKRFANDSNVTIIEGDSGEVLKKLTAEIKEPTFFWLDGHYSSEFFIGEEYIKTAKGEKNTPIEKELTYILQSDGKHIILIDDARLFVGLNDYPTISKIKRLVKEYNPHYNVKVSNDIIYILL